jgi:UDP-glucose 4-epimerase
MEDAISDRRVLVTGGAGFIGRHLVKSLLPDNEVTVLDHFSTSSPQDVPAGASVVGADVRNRDVLARAMDGVDTVFHLAAMVDVGASVDAPFVCHETNASATVALLELARAEDARVVFASSAAIYGHPTALPIPEDEPKCPASPYGIAKLTADLQVRRFQSLYGLPTVALRFFNVYGPPRSGGVANGVVGAFLERARDGDPLRVHGDGQQTRDFVHVSDVVRALHLAATTDHTGEAFNVGTDEETSVLTLAETVRDIVGRDVPIEHTSERAGDVTHSRADITKARSMLGFEPSVDVKSGLRSTASNS